MIDCNKVSTLTSESHDRKLKAREFASMWIHRLLCRACRTYRRQILTLRRGARSLAHESTAPMPMAPSAKERIRARLREDSTAMDRD